MAQEMDGLDYECELVIVVGKQCKDVPEAQALDCVFGYAVGNDMSHRDWQMKHGNQWAHGKSFDGWAPYGPGIVSAKLIEDPQSLAIWTKVNGEMLQVSRRSYPYGPILTLVEWQHCRPDLWCQRDHLAT